MRPRSRPFPFHRLPRLSQADLRLADHGPGPAVLERVSACLGEMVRGLGLGGVSLKLIRQRSMALEELRSCFPGGWPLALFVDLAAERSGALLVDPLLLGRVLRVADGSGQVLGWHRGGRGALAAMMAAGLESLSAGDSAWQGWRYAGLLESPGDLGRYWSQHERLCASWLGSELGWDEGCVVWLEPEGSALKRGSRGPNAELPADFDLSFRLRWGRCRLSVEELSEVEAGDVLLLQANVQGLWTGDLWIEGECKDSCLTVASVRREVSPMDVQENAGMEAMDCGDIPVTLVAEGGSCQLSLERLASLRAGDVLELGEALMAPLVLRCGDRVLGRGELVEVEGRRAVRISRWALKGAEHVEGI